VSFHILTDPQDAFPKRGSEAERDLVLHDNAAALYGVAGA